MRAIGLLGLGLSVLAVWMVQHPYGDIMHDAALYSLLALARLHPDPLASDIFLRFGSQDHFTLFSPAFAFMIRHFDLAEAAAIMTFISQATLCGCAWLLARRFMSPASALLAVGLLLALPGFYGSGHSFSYTENFLTPRLPAGALALASLATALAQRMKTAVACILAALLIHPIIACAGVAMLLVTCLASPRPRLAATVAGSLLVVALLGAVLVPQGPFARFGTQWLALVNHFTSYLFVGNWYFDDWVRLGIQIAVMLLGCLFATQPMLRTVCGCAIVCALGGIALTWIWSDVLHVILPTQMQFWRWVWITSVLSVLLSPVIVSESWNSGSALRRAALIFIGCSLLLRVDSGASVTLVLSIASAVIARWYPQFKYGRYILLGAFAFLALGLGLAVGDGLPQAAWLAAALFGVWWIGGLLRTSVWKASVLCAAAAIVCLAAAPPAFRSWTRFQYTPESRALYSQWRDQLPAHAEVLWPESPVGVWYLLDRTSYWSPHQMAGLVYSRPAAVELDRRISISRDALIASSAWAKLRQDAEFVKQIRTWAPATLESLDPAGLPTICADRNLGYFVSSRRLGPIAMPPVTPDPDRPKRRFYIHDCKDFRGS
ncbi:MAG TPA: hypothetical protein VNO35_00090 [Steroidobacteraceae bacterium]|nr:hypothetical protein [Steroidobacteraceae bacterium]